MKRPTILLILTLIIGIFLGWLFFHTPQVTKEKSDHHSEAAKVAVWTCAMHPQIHMDQPGKCPICAMELIPLTQNSTASIDPDAIHLTKESAQLANVMTSIVTTRNPVKELRLYGKVQTDERLLQNQVSHIPGRIEKLMVNFTGESVAKGQKLAQVYSPELVTAQQELLEAVKTKLAQPEIYSAAKEKLHQWKLTEGQISAIENSGNIQTNIDIISNTSGIVTARRVNNGDYVNQGSVLYEISDLSTVWVLFDAYESDLPFVKKGNKLGFTVQALPGITFSGAIIFIDPVIDPVNRVAKIRVEISNPGGKLKPEMFVTGIVKSNLEEYRNRLVIPRSAVLWTGKRSIVYVKLQNSEEPVFKIRNIELGPLLENSYVVMNGLKDGEEIVTQGAFSVDAAAQLEGKPSMMNPVKPEKDIVIKGQNQPLIGTVEDQFKVSGNCDMCRERIVEAAKSVEGVLKAEWNKSDKVIHIQYDENKTSLDAIEKSIAKTGHDTEKYRASDEAYKLLPECCLYRNK